MHVYVAVYGSVLQFAFVHINVRYFQADELDLCVFVLRVCHIQIQTYPEMFMYNVRVCVDIYVIYIYMYVCIYIYVYISISHLDTH